MYPMEFRIGRFPFMNRIASLAAAAVVTGLSAAAIGVTAASQDVFDSGSREQSAESLSASPPAGAGAFAADTSAWSTSSNGAAFATKTSRKDDDDRDREDDDRREHEKREHDDDD
jgi:hypothetical protein